MASPTLDALAAAVTKITDASDAAVALINGISARIQTAVDAALANGATAAELQPVQAEADLLASKAQTLADAVAANTPAA